MDLPDINPPGPDDKAIEGLLHAHLLGENHPACSTVCTNLRQRISETQKPLPIYYEHVEDCRT